ncbi:hypothetical protein TNCV_3987141 [Trichonephila clavipes]|nr:hypothetical protein TNCV_3987141 [Trichonephila clavipes]
MTYPSSDETSDIRDGPRNIESQSSDEVPSVLGLFIVPCYVFHPGCIPFSLLEFDT